MTNPKPNHLHPHTFLTIKPFKPLKIITMNWFIKCFKQYADFKGRARRREFWWFTLINFIIIFILVIGMIVPLVGSLLNNPEFMEMASDSSFDAQTYGSEFEADIYRQMLHTPFFYIYVIYALIILVPSLAVTVRRLHDTGRSGWWALLILVGYLPNLIKANLNPGVGMNIILALLSLAACVVLIVFMFLDSQPGSNKWGPNPKEPNWDDETDLQPAE